MPGLGIFKNLTKEGVIDPTTGKIVYYDSPAAAGVAEAQAMTKLAQPETPVSNAMIPPVPSDGSEMPQPEPKPTTFTDNTQAMPKTFRPTFDQATTDRYGNVAPGISPALTKGGVLLKILRGGLQGGMDSIAGGALDAPQHGESTFGKGVAAAQQMPLIRVARAQQQRRAELENAQAEVAAQPVKTPWGVMPLWKAKQVGDLAKTQAETEKDNAQASKAGYIPIQGVGLGHVTDDGKIDIIVSKPDDMKAAYNAAFMKARKEGRDPMQDPDVQTLADGISNLQKQPAVPASQDKRDFANIMSKVSAEGNLPAGALNDSRLLTAAIKSSKTLSPDEKNKAIGYMAANPTPSTTGTNAVIRLEGLGETRGMPVTDTKTGVTVPMSWNDYNKVSKAEPGRYVSPQYDTSTQAGLKAWRDLAPSGTVGKQLTSYEAFIGHTGDLYDAVSNLKNSGFPDLNKPINWYRNHTGDPRVKEFLAKLDPVKDEFKKLLVGGALQAEDRTDADKILDENASPAQMLKVLPSLAHTGNLRIQANNESFKRATGEDIPNLISPEAAAVLKKLSVAAPGGVRPAVPSKGNTNNTGAGGVTFIPLN